MHLIFFCYHLKNIFSFLYYCFILCNPISESWAFLKLKSFWRSGKLLLASSHAFWVSRHSFQIATWWSDRECTKKKLLFSIPFTRKLCSKHFSSFPLPWANLFLSSTYKVLSAEKEVCIPFSYPFFTDHTQ